MAKVKENITCKQHSKNGSGKAKGTGKYSSYADAVKGHQPMIIPLTMPSSSLSMPPLPMPAAAIFPPPSITLAPEVISMTPDAEFDMNNLQKEFLANVVDPNMTITEAKTQINTIRSLLKVCRKENSTMTHGLKSSFNARLDALDTYCGISCSTLSNGALVYEVSC